VFEPKVRAEALAERRRADRREAILSGAPILLALVFRQQGPYIVADIVV